MNHSDHEGNSGVVWHAPNWAPPTALSQVLTVAGGVLLLVGIGTALGARDSDSTWANPMIFVYPALACVAVGVASLWYGRSDAIVEVRFEPSAAPSKFTIRRLNDSTSTYSAADVDRVSVTCSAYGDKLWMDIRIGEAKHRTGAGPVKEAQPLLAFFEQAGATVTVDHLDLPD
ncbi:hypothetical protein OHR68_33325 [Spirillospora sp. NBC_00431]